MHPHRLVCAREFLSPRLFLAIVFSAIMAAGCAALGLEDVNIISIEEEWEMGRQLEEELARELEVSQDAALTRMGERIVVQTPMAGRDWRFYVVEDQTVNAFNVPGGLIYVYTGLIDMAADENELAAVVAHEIGHGVARHGTQRLTRQYGLAVLAGVVLGEEPGVLQQIVAEVVAAGAIARFSRAQEYEADELGVRYMATAGYDPRGMIAFFERLLELQRREPGTVEQFFATHPATADRIQRVEAEIEGLE